MRYPNFFYVWMSQTEHFYTDKHLTQFQEECKSQP